MNVEGFTKKHPEYCFDFTQPIRQQKRIFDHESLASLPAELEPSFAYRSGGRGRPNLNQTLTHAQCSSCKRVLRNDFFYTPPSMMQRNVVYSHCQTCAQNVNAERYELINSDTLRTRRMAIWQYIAPACLCCGFDKHSSAMDMHHTEAKEAEIAELVTDLVLTPNVYKAERLLHECKQGIPLCSNCHRMVHAGAIELPPVIGGPKYHLAELLQLAQAVQSEKK